MPPRTEEQSAMWPSRSLAAPDPGRVGRGQHEDPRKDGQDQLDDAIQVKVQQARE